jgi:hypothetical protein
MNGQKLLNNTLRINAIFSLLSGIDFIVFDRTITGIVTGRDLRLLAPTGIMLIGFAVFVFIISMMKEVNKYLVGTIIAMDALWVIGSLLIVGFGFTALTTNGLFLILLIALVIALLASFQTVGLKRHLQTQAI